MVEREIMEARKETGFIQAALETKVVEARGRRQVSIFNTADDDGVVSDQ